MEGIYREINLDTVGVEKGIINIAYEEDIPDQNQNDSETESSSSSTNNETKVNFENGQSKQTEINLESETAAKNEEHCSRRRSSSIFETTKPRLASLSLSNAKRFGSMDSIALEKLKAAEQPSEKTGWKRHAGIILAFVGSISVTLASLIVKVLDDYHPFTLGWYRFIASTIFTIPLMIYYQYVKKAPVYGALYPFDLKSRDQWTLLVLIIMMSIAKSCGFVFRYFAVQYLTVADGTVLSLSGAVFVVFLAHCILGEKCGFFSFFIAVFTFSGVVIIARPPMITGQSEFDQDTLMGTSYGVASMIVWSIQVIILRKTRKLHFMAMLFIPSVWGIFQCALFMYLYGVTKIIPDSWDDVLMLTVFVTLSFIGAISVVFAMKYDNATSYSLIRSWDIIFAYLLQFIFLAVVPDVYSVIGGLIVISGIFLSTFRKWVITQPIDSKMRKRFAFLQK